MAHRLAIAATLLALAWPTDEARASGAAEALPTAQAMIPLLGLPYTLYARQPETEARRSANCLTAVVFALRRSGFSCPALSPDQAWSHWRASAQPLALGRTAIPTRGLLLFTRDHFLLLHSDRNSNSVVDADDDVIHAPYRPVEITQVGHWLKEPRPFPQVWVVPIDDSFACPTAKELRDLPVRLRATSSGAR
ncbi:MAG: hypothetical protein RLZZ618_2659 [Pseudomonadota bacterium]